MADFSRWWELIHENEVLEDCSPDSAFWGLLPALEISWSKKADDEVIDLGSPPGDEFGPSSRLIPNERLTLSSFELFTSIFFVRPKTLSQLVCDHPHTTGLTNRKQVGCSFGGGSHQQCGSVEGTPSASFTVESRKWNDALWLAGLTTATSFSPFTRTIKLRTLCDILSGPKNPRRESMFSILPECRLQ